MKKNLAKRIVLGLLTGAVLMSSSVAWANGELVGGTYKVYIKDGCDYSLYVGSGSGGIEGHRDNIVGEASGVKGNDGVVLGYNANVGGVVTIDGGVALGNNTRVLANNSVALGYGSIASEENVVSVGSGNANDDYATRKIVNVTAGENATDAVNVGQLKAVENIVGTGKVVTDGSGITCITNGTTSTDTVRNLANAVHANWDGLYAKTGSADFSGGIYSERVRNASDLTDAVYKLDTALGKVYTKTEADARYVKIVEDNTDPTKTTTSIGDFVVTDVGSSSTVTINAGANQQVVFDEDGITVGKHSTRMDGTGFYVWADGQNNNTTSDHDPDKAIASINDKGEIKAANGAFKVDANGNVIGGTYNGVDIRALANSVASNDAVAGLNQRLEKTNAKINKVGAGAAALAALHPLDYDPDDKLTFSAGMGNYAGENAAALGAFYRPNEKFMLSLGGTMGNGENMVNLGLSIGLDKANGFAKMSKRELIQEVNAVKAENEAMKDQLANADERIAKLEALVAQLVAK